MQLIPFRQTIYFNSSEISASDLASFTILALTYHPLYVNLLYLLYGIANGSRSYRSLHLVLRDSNTGNFIQNHTVSENYGCRIGCEIKATQYLFLIESQTLIGIHSINTGAQNVNFPPIYQMNKPASSYLTDIFRHADIFYDKYVVFNLTSPPDNQAIFGRLSGSRYIYNISLNGSQVLDTGLQDNYVYAALYQSPIITYFYDCVQCIYSGSVSDISNFTIQINLSISVGQSFRLYQGYQIANQYISGGKVYWAYNGIGFSQRFVFNGSSYVFLGQISTFEVSSTANRQKLFYFGSGTSLFQESFDIANYSTSYEYSFGEIIQKVAISNPSTFTALALRGKNDHPWQITQYQVVQNCSNYNATTIRFNDLVCYCFQYDSNNRCISLLEKNSSSESFPIAAVIAVIAGIIFIVTSGILIKKNYKRCVKGRNRTPWKYNPIELMSFES